MADEIARSTHIVQMDGWHIGIRNRNKSYETSLSLHPYLDPFQIMTYKHAKRWCVMRSKVSNMDIKVMMSRRIFFHTYLQISAWWALRRGRCGGHACTHPRRISMELIRAIRPTKYLGALRPAQCTLPSMCGAHLLAELGSFSSGPGSRKETANLVISATHLFDAH